MQGFEQLNVGMLLDDWVEDVLVAALKHSIRLSILHMKKPVVVSFEEEDADEQLQQSQASVNMDFYLRLNRSGRRLLRDGCARNSNGGGGADDYDDYTPIGLWSNLLAHAASNTNSAGTPDVLYYLLQQKPDLACGLFNTAT